MRRWYTRTCTIYIILLVAVGAKLSQHNNTVTILVSSQLQRNLVQCQMKTV